MRKNRLFALTSIALFGLASCGGTKAPTVEKALINVYQVPLTADLSAIDTSKKQASEANIASNKKADTAVLSKEELGSLYGMSSAPNGEWNVQAKAFETYVAGKEVAALNTTYKSNHNPDGVTEVTGCSISMEDFAAAIVEGASELYTEVALAAGTYKLVTGSVVSYDASKSQIAVAASAYLLDSNGKIAGAYFDVLQATAELVDGAIVLKKSATAVKDAGAKVCETKKELKERYGMSAAAAEQGEWYTQAKAFETYCVGKTVAEVASANYKSHYNANGTVEVAGCSISTGDFTKTLSGAIKEVEVTVKKGTYKLGLGTVVAEFSSGVLNVTLGAVLSK